jgi:PBSX family phage terminase large subunit
LTTSSTLEPLVITYGARGACLRTLTLHDPEVIVAGPAGTGKSRAWLEKLNACAVKYPGMRGLMLRKTRTSLTQSALVTMNEKVHPEIHGARFHTTQQAYLYPNGSVLVVAGLDKDSKVLSQEYDLIYVQEATEITEHEWEILTTRARNWAMPYQQVGGDCNPDAPTHWIRQRAARGGLTFLESRHEDNPLLVNPDGSYTTEGAAYLSRLDALTGVRFKRLRQGIWAAAEGMVYDEAWDPAVHVIDRFPIPASWARYLSIDFGYINPFCCQWWAMDHDGRLYRYREIYMTRRLVEDHAREIKALSAGESLRLVICDHDAEDRATLTRHLDLDTVPATKTISPGIQAVAMRLRTAGDGRPRLFYLRDSLVERDPRLEEAKLPCCTEEEYESYVWDTRLGRKKGEVPVDKDNHGMDATRYMVAQFDVEPEEEEAHFL